MVCPGTCCHARQPGQALRDDVELETSISETPRGTKIKLVLQLSLAAAIAVGFVAYMRVETTRIFPVYCALVSFATPKRFVWLTLAVWTFILTIWTGVSLNRLMHGGDIFPKALFLLGLATSLLGFASWLSYRRYERCG